MGSSTRHRQRFLTQNPICAFCGGNTFATTIEHCPSRALFQHRKWPEGFEFPACKACNQGSGDDDLIVAMLARMDPFEEKGNLDGSLKGLMYRVNKQKPGLLAKMMPSAIEARRSNLKLGIEPQLGQTHQEAGGVKITEEIHASVCTLARKLVKGIYYRDIKRIFPDTGCLLLNWFTNADLIKDGNYVIFDILKELSGDAPPLKRGGSYLNDQFEYKITFSPDADFLVLQAKFGNSFGFVVFGCAIEGRLEKTVENLRERTERSGPFAILQSTTLK